MPRDIKQAMRHTKDLPKFGEVLERRATTLKNLGSRPSVTMEWDLNDAAKQAQVFRIELRDKDLCLDAYISKQELEHYLRAV